MTESRSVHGVLVHGIALDLRTRCAHYHSTRDIIAIRFKCCGEWYACYDCHTGLAEHAAQVWPVAERLARAVLCGACGRKLTIAEYLDCGSTCPACRAAFNPGCERHYPLYFEPDDDPGMIRPTTWRAPR